MAHIEHKPDRITTPTTLWSVSNFGRLTVPSNRPHRWDNVNRSPSELVVLQVIYSGRLQFIQAGVSRLLSPGDAFMFRYGEQSSYGLPEPRSSTYVCEWVCMTGEGLAAHWDAYRAAYGSVVSQAVKTPIVGVMREVIELVADGQPKPITQVAAGVHALVMALYKQADHRQIESLRPVDQAVEQILRHPTSLFSIKSLADRFGLSREHISRVFVERTGETPSDFLSRVRLASAMQLLKESDLSIGDVAKQSGFNTTRGLSVVFRQANGLTPAQWREREKQKQRRGKASGD